MTNRFALLIAVLLLVPAFASAEVKSPERILLDMKTGPDKKAMVGPVDFPHLAHQKIYKCAECHPKVFTQQKGKDDITMAGIRNGQWCGVCHAKGKTAFAPDLCNKCHGPRAAAKPAETKPGAAK